MNHHKQPQDAAFLPEGHDVESMTIVKQRMESIRKEVGTLGGGNHFIELQHDEEDNLWIMIHSGSRNLGARVGAYYNQLAENLNARWHSAVNPDIHMAFLPKGEKEFTNYWNEMLFCIDFALCNRCLMMQRIEEVLADALPGIEFEPMINITQPSKRTSTRKLSYTAREPHWPRKVRWASYLVHRVRPRTS